MLNSLEMFIPKSHQDRLRRLKRATAIAFADRTLLQDSTQSLFKANLAKEERKKKIKEAGERATYGSAFGRVLTEAQAEAYRIEEEEKAEVTRLRKEAVETRKVNAAEKKKEAERKKDERIKRLAAQAEKKEKEDELKAERKRERVAKAMQKEEGKRLKMLNQGPSKRRRGNFPTNAPFTSQSQMEFTWDFTQTQLNFVWGSPTPQARSLEASPSLYGSSLNAPYFIRPVVREGSPDL